MKIVIDMPDDDYEYIKLLHEGYTDYQTTLKLYHAVKNGTVLPKGHGDLIDADELKTSRIMALVAEKNASQNEISFAPLVCILKEDIDNAMTIVEADRGDRE